jgi:soluble lytic murein transglycosylase-like protein
VSWQESGWKQRVVSPANAIGAMQVIPSTGRFSSSIVGRDLDLLKAQDNITAGVVLLDRLTGAAKLDIAVAGYYQGLGGVRKNGMYPDTKQYVKSVLRLKGQFEKGWDPLK